MKSRALVLVAPLLLLLALLPLAAPASAASEPHILVSQRTALRGGDEVRVWISGLPGGTPVWVGLCDTQSEEESCGPLAEGTTGPLGRLSLPVTLADPVLRSQPFGDPVAVYCRADACRLFAVWDDGSGQQSVATPALRFVGSPASITATPTSDLADGQQVAVSGTALSGAGRRVRVYQAACFRIVQGVGCYGELPAQRARVHRGGGWSVGYTVHRFLPDGTDCTDPTILGSCVLVASVGDGRGGVDESYGIARWGEPSVLLTFAP